LPVFPFWGGGGFVPLAGGGAFGLGLVLGGGGGGFCSGAPPGCELGALAGGACSFDGGVFGVVDSFAGGFADEPPPLFELPPQAAAESDSAATHSNNRLRFIRSPLEKEIARRRRVASRVPPPGARRRR
jgi:hypothetical protein